MSGLLLGIVRPVCTCWFHNVVTLPPGHVSDIVIIIIIIIIIIIGSSNRMTFQGLSSTGTAV